MELNHPSLNLKVIRIHKLEKDSAVKAFADVCFNDFLVIKGLRIVEGERGLFVSMPQKQGRNSRWYNTVHCLSKELTEIVKDQVLTAYKSNS